MRIVLDTNVVVSALLHPGRVPDRAIAALRDAGALVLYDDRVSQEYRSVLARPKFQSIDRGSIETLLASILGQGELVQVTSPYEGPMTDPDDRAFVEVALAGRADALVTGNPRHYPTGLGFEVLVPAQLLARLTGI